MSVFASTMIGSFLKQMIPVVTLALFMGPYAANSELLLQLHDVWSGTPVPDASRQTAGRPADLCLNSNGSLAIQRRDVSLTMAYSPPKDSIESQERPMSAQWQDCPSISGISFKLSLQF